MTWFSFQGNRRDMNLSGVLEKQAAALGFHGYATQSQADANKNSVNLIQAPELDAIENSYSIGGGSGGITGADSPVPVPNQSAPGTLGRDILGNVAVGNWFLRIGEILFGIVLAGVGIARLTGVSNAVSKAVRMAPK